MSPEPLPATAFPSGEYFEAVASAASSSLDLDRLGVAQLRLAITMRQPDGPPRTFGIVFDGYELSSAGEIGDLSAFDPDAAVEGDVATWSEMFLNIAEHGAADLHHTLNALSIAGAPLEVTGSDPVRRDRVFRYAETIQQFLDAAALVPVAPVPVAPGRPAPVRG